MDEKELKVYIGNKIKEFRVKNKLTQNELGKMIGVKNNTISAYERGIIAPAQDMLFKLSSVLECNVDDFFPETNHKDNYLQRLQALNEDLDINEMNFLKQLIEKALTLKGEDRKKFLESIKFTVDYYENINEKD